MDNIVGLGFGVLGDFLSLFWICLFGLGFCLVLFVSCVFFLFCLVILIKQNSGGGRYFHST